MELVIYSLIVYGITYIMVFGSVFEWLRSFMFRINAGFLGTLFSCPLCLSTWLGFFFSYFFFSITSMYFPDLYTNVNTSFIKDNSFYFKVFFDGMFTAAVTYIIYSIHEAIDRFHTTHNQQ